MLIDFLIVTVLVLALHIYRIWRAHNKSVDQLTQLSKHLIEAPGNDRSALATPLYKGITPRLPGKRDTAG